METTIRAFWRTREAEHESTSPTRGRWSLTTSSVDWYPTSLRNQPFERTKENSLHRLLLATLGTDLQ